MGRAGRWAGVTALAGVLLAGGFAGAAGGLAFLAAAAAGLAGLLSVSRFLPALLFGVAVSGGLPAPGGLPGSFPWPSLLVLAFASGAGFAEMLSPPSPRPARPMDRVVLSLALLWSFSALVAVGSARTLWAAVRGLSGRVVNILGMTDIGVGRETVLTLSAVISGTIVYAVLRREDPCSRRRAIGGLLAGAALSGLVALLQSLQVLPAPRWTYWVGIGRFQGLAADPNALGVLMGLAVMPAIAGVLVAPKGRRAWWGALSGAMIGGLAASGSRSGFIIVAAGAVVLAVGAVRRHRGRALPALAAVFIIGTLLWAALEGGRGPGSLGRRLIQSFDTEVPLAGRTSSRPLLWKAAAKAWQENPLGGIGWNAYSWHLPNIARDMGVALAAYDNPGNFYLQTLCETGLAGALLFAGFIVLVLAAALGSRPPDSRSTGDDPRPGLAAAAIGFVLALGVGSHLLAAEVAVAFFAIVGALASAGPEPPRGAAAATRRAAWAAALLAGVAALASLPTVLSTFGPDAAFRYSPRIGISGEESSAQGPFRWMGPRAAWKLAAGESRRITVVFQHPARPAERFRITSGGAVLFERRLLRGVPRTLDLLASPYASTIFRFANSASFRPGGSGPSADPRVLAMQVFEDPR